MYLYDGANLIEEADGAGNLAARYVFGSGIDEPLAVYRGATWEFYQADGLGSVTSLSTSVGTVSDSFVYDSFGNVTSSTGTFTQPFRYTGREWDAETGLYYYRARYYDPQIGRFISQDPVEFGGGINFYGYVTNNSTNLTDPLGWWPRGTDKWFGYNDREFQRWFHLCWKTKGGPDANKDEIIEAYKEWIDRGKPTGGKCWNKRPECEKQPQEQEQPDDIPLIDPLANWINKKLNYPFKGPFWDKVRQWQGEWEDAVKRGPQPIPGPVPGPIPVPLPPPVFP